MALGTAVAAAAATYQVPEICTTHQIEETGRKYLVQNRTVDACDIADSAHELLDVPLAGWYASVSPSACLVLIGTHLFCCPCAWC